MSLSYVYQGYIVPASTLIPIIAGFISYNKITRPIKTLVIYLSIALIINIAGIVMAAYSKNNLPLLHFYTIFELIAVSIYYKQAFSSKKMALWINIIMIVFPLLCIINFSFIQSIYQFNTYTRPLEAIIIIIYSGVYLAGPGSTGKHELTTSAGRWVAGGFVFYFCSSFFQFIFSNIVSRSASHDIKMVIWNLHATFVLIMYVFFFLAIKNERSKR
jgi:hypothetical protein